MAKFVRQTSDVAQALDRLQGFAENLISLETNRRIQLSREKEARMVEAYQYMLGNEEEQISELEASLDSIEQNLQSRGIELKSVKPEYKTIASEELLAAANEGAAELLNVKLEDSRSYKERLQNSAREARKIGRHIDLFDDAITLVDPRYTGSESIVEAEDVAHAAELFKKEHDKYGPEIEQRLAALQTESELERLQTDYYARLARESEEKRTALTSQQMDATLKITTLEDVKKETLEGVKAMTYQPVSSMVEEYRPIISKQGEIQDGEDALTGKSLNTNDVAVKQQEINAEYLRVGSILFPWAFSADQALIEAQGLQSSLIKAGNGNYQELINYFKKGNAQYKLWEGSNSQAAEGYRTDIQSMFGIDIASDAWVGQLEELWWSVGQSEIEQATEALKAGRQFLPELEDESQTTIDPLLKEYGLE